MVTRLVSFLPQSDLCVEMWAYQSNAGAWHNLRCDTRRGYVCQTYKGW